MTDRDNHSSRILIFDVSAAITMNVVMDEIAPRIAGLSHAQRAVSA